jgi:hypothetical protein
MSTVSPFAIILDLFEMFLIECPRATRPGFDSLNHSSYRADVT